MTTSSLDLDGRRLLELAILDRFDDVRRDLGHDYGNGQRASELMRRRRELQHSRFAVLAEWPRLDAVLQELELDGDRRGDELGAAWARVARPRLERIAAEDFRRSTPSTQRTLEAWRELAAELELEGGPR